MGRTLRAENITSMIRPTVPQDLVDFVPMMREDDRLEVEAITGLDPLSSLAIGLFHSDACMTGFAVDGSLAGIMGVVPIVPRQIGSIWFLSTEAVVKHRRQLLTEARVWLDEQQALYPVLTNVVSVRNEVHKRLLKHLGFTFLEPIDNYGAGRIRVIPFERKR